MFGISYLFYVLVSYSCIHRKDAENAEELFFSFAAERAANE
jgi:hypothetical protein